MKRFANPAAAFRACACAGLVLLSAVGPTPAQETPPEQSGGYYVQTWQEEDGLPRNNVTAIAQTPDGYLWLGTRFGLKRYDGVNFIPVASAAVPTTLRGRISRMTCDRAGRLWIGTSADGLVVYAHGEFRVLGVTNGLLHASIQSLSEDRDGTMWVTIGGGNIWRIKNGWEMEFHGFLQGEKKPTDPNQFAGDGQGRFWFAQENNYGQWQNGAATNVTRLNNASAQLCPSRDGGMWVMTAGRLLKFGLPTEPPLQFPRPESWQKKVHYVTKLFEDRQGNLWIGTWDRGVFRFRDGKFLPVTPGGHVIMDIFEDAEGSVWAGTDGGGLHKIRPRVFRVLNGQQGLPQSSILSVCEDQAGNGWLTMQGGTIVRFGPDGGVEIPAALASFYLTTVLPAPAGGLWVGSGNGKLLHYDNTNNRVQLLANEFKTRNNETRVLYRDRQDRLWNALSRSNLRCYENGKFRFTDYFAKQGLPGRMIWAITDSPNGEAWFGAFSGELYRYQHNHFTAYGTADGLPGTTIGTLYVSADNSVWIGTLGDGLGRWRDGKLRFVSVAQGLHDSVISQIVEDDFGFFWFGSTRGIFRIRKTDLDEFMDGKRATLESIGYGKADGLANIECPGGYQPSVWKTHSGQLWFATSKGLVQVDPGALPLNTNPPPLALEQVLVEDQPVAPTPPLTLPWNHKNLEFKYAALSFVAPEKVRFRRQLVGFDENWVDDGAARAAKYSRLAPGRYEFRFTACNDTGLWNARPVSLAFTVMPAWWQTWIFRVTVLLVAAGGFGAVVRYFSIRKTNRALKLAEQAHALERERMRIARDIHDDVGARLAQMAFLSDMAEADLEKSGTESDPVKKIAEGARQTVRALDEIVWAVNPSKDTLPHLVEYVSHYANNLFRGTEIRCRQDLPANLPEWPLPAEFRHHLFLATKEALNNVCKHSNATEVWVRVNVRLPMLELIVEDNGAGFSLPGVGTDGDGLQNMRTRLAGLGGECRIESKPGAGTRLCLQVKLPQS